MEKYKVDASGNELYAKSDDNSERYIKNGIFDVMAKKRDSTGKLNPYFARDKDGHPICPILYENMHCLELDIPYPKQNNCELYPKLNDKEYYIAQNKICRYALDENGMKYYASYYCSDEMNQWLKIFYYAFRHDENGDIVDFPIINQRTMTPFYITYKDRIIYPCSKTKRKVIYPVNIHGDEYYVEFGGKQCYGHIQPTINSAAFPVYAKKKWGEDILALNNKVPYYAFSMYKGAKKREYYPRKNDRAEEFYLKWNNHEIYAKNDNGEYCALDKKRHPYYAINNNMIEIYPVSQLGKQIYRVENKVERVAENKKTKMGFYAKDQFLNEFYPKKFE